MSVLVNVLVNAFMDPVELVRRSTGGGGSDGLFVVVDLVEGCERPSEGRKGILRRSERGDRKICRRRCSDGQSEGV